MDFKSLAQKATTLSEIMSGRDKGSTEDIKNYPITIIDFDAIKIENNTVYVYVIENDNDHFYFAGAVLRGIFDNFITEYEGDIENCREDFRNSEGLCVKLTDGLNSKKQPVTLVEIL